MAQQAELAQSVFKGLLPVFTGRTGSFHVNGIVNKAVHPGGHTGSVSPDGSKPEAVHRLLTFLTEGSLALGQWEEERELLILNNDGNQGYCPGSSQFTDEIPGREIEEEKPNRKRIFH